MEKNRNILDRVVICLVLMLLVSPLSVGAQERKPMVEKSNNGAGEELVVSGTVRDRNSRKRLENVNIVLIGTNIGTVTNAEGSFSLKIPADKAAEGVEISCIGYASQWLNAAAFRIMGKDVSIYLMPSVNVLGEVMVFGGDARSIVEAALLKVADNYPDSPNMLNVFYRETIQKRSRYISISEAMMDVFKSDYRRRTIHRDKVQLTRARRLLSQKRSDTLSVKVAGGPTQSLVLDLVKNPNLLFDDVTINYYEFEQERSVMLDDRQQFVIRFRPRLKPDDYALCTGLLYIDCQRLSFTRAEFSLDMSNRDLVVRSILKRKPFGLRFRPLEVNFIVGYRQQGDRTYLDYLRNEIRFKCDWRRRFFSATYTALSEMVVVDREEQPAEVFSRAGSFRPTQVFYDEVDSYWDADFWKSYNIIEPTESLENAVRKLKRK